MRRSESNAHRVVVGGTHYDMTARGRLISPWCVRSILYLHRFPPT